MNSMILHMDADAFFASVEVAKNPSLRGKPVVVGGERGIATAFTYEAKALGVTRGMPVYKIRKIFPQVVIKSGDYEMYEKFSKRMFDIVRRYVDAIEEYSTDECFAKLSLTPTFGSTLPQGEGKKRENSVSSFCSPSPWERGLGGEAESLARAIQSNIARELDIPVSVGVSVNKTLAKVASKWNKPRGIVIIPHDKIYEFLAKLNVDKVWGIGPATSKLLASYGVHTCLEFVLKSEKWVSEALTKPGLETWRELRGERVFSINTEYKEAYQSISSTGTFRPSSDPNFLFTELARHIEEACAKARRYGQVTSKVNIFLKTKDFHYTTADVKLDLATNVPEFILNRADPILRKLVRPHTLYRATGVTLVGLAKSGESQPDLFGLNLYEQKLEKVYKTIDSLDIRFGHHSVYLAASCTARGSTLSTQPCPPAGRKVEPQIQKEFSLPLLGEVS